MSVNVYVPVRLRLDPNVIRTRTTDFEAALTAAAIRALAQSRATTSRHPHAFARAQIPEFSWTGAAVTELTDIERAAFEARITELLYDVFNSQITAGGRAGVTLGKLPTVGGEGLFHLARDDTSRSSGRRRSSPSALPMDEWKVALRRQTEQELRRLYRGDLDLFMHYFLEINSSHVDKLLIEFGRRHPVKLRRILRDLLKKHARELAATIKRGPSDLTYTRTPEMEEYLSTAARVVIAARVIPEARPLLSEGEAQTPGVARVQGLIDALIAMYHRLWELLQRNTFEHTAEEVTDNLQAEGIGAALLRESGAVAALAGIPEMASLLSELQLDLVENIRWISLVYDRVKSLDAELAEYRYFYGKGADEAAEMIALRKARTLYLDPLRTVALPTRARIAELLLEANQYYEDRVGQIGDLILARIEETQQRLVDWHIRALTGVDELNSARVFIAGDVTGVTVVDDDFFTSYIRTRDGIQAIGVDIADAYSRRGGPDYVSTLHAVQAKLGPLAVQLQLLSFWKNVVDFKIQLGALDVGGFGIRESWLNGLAGVRNEVKQQYDNPDYPYLNAKFKRWQHELEVTREQIEIIATIEAAITVVVVIFVIIATLGVGAAIGAGAALTAGETLVVIVIEAGVVTVGTTVVLPLLLGKSIDPAKVLVSFGENVALSGLLRLFSVGVLAAARWLAPGRTLVQLGLIVGGTTLVGALPVGYELIKNRIETGRWSTQLSMFMGANVVLTLSVFAFTGGKVRNALVALNKADVLADLIRLQTATERMADKFLAASAGQLTKPQFEELQARAARILPDFERLARRLADFSDVELAQLGFTKAYLRDFPERLAELTEFIAAIKFVPPAAGTPRLALAEVAGTGLARIGVQSYEYDSAVLSAAALAARLRGAGYQPDLLGGGVMRLSLPHGEQAFLLPAGAPRLTLEDVISPIGQISKDHPQLQQAYDAYLARCAAKTRVAMNAHEWARHTTRGTAADYLKQVLGDNWRAVRQGQYPGYHPELIERPSAAPAEGSPGAPGGALWKEKRVPIGDIRLATDEVGEPYWTFPDLDDGVVLILPSGTRVWRDPHTRVIWEEHPVAPSVSAKRALTAGEAVIPSAGEMSAAQAGQQRAHGAASPGLGFDSPYSVARTPPEVNLAIENSGIELWVRNLRDNPPPNVQYLFMTGTARQAGSLTERTYRVSASSRGKIVDLVTFKVTVGPDNKATLEVVSIAAEPMAALGMPKNVDIPKAFARKLGFDIRASKEAKVAQELTTVAKRNQEMGVRLEDLAVRLTMRGNRAQLLEIERAQRAVADAETFLSNASPSDPRVGQLDAELRDLARRVGRWQNQADVDRLNWFTENVRKIIGR